MDIQDHRFRLTSKVETDHVAVELSSEQNAHGNAVNGSMAVQIPMDIQDHGFRLTSKVETDHVTVELSSEQNVRGIAVNGSMAV